MDDTMPAKAKNRLRIGRLAKRFGISDSCAAVRADDTASSSIGVGILGAMVKVIRGL